jgi:glycerol-3-phosphate O-acyltransferase
VFLEKGSKMKALNLEKLFNSIIYSPRV